MLSITTQADYQHQPYYFPNRPLCSLPSSNLSGFTLMSMAGSQAAQSISSSAKSEHDASVAQALEMARESAEGASDPTITSILENALSQIWRKVEAHPTSYVMSRDEFAVFNYFQYRFVNNRTASEARKRYWDNVRA